MFVGRGQENYEVPARVIAVLEPDPEADSDGDGERLVEIFLDRTPFYAESGGQVGDTGTIVTESGIADVQDTVLAVPGLFVHRARVSGELRAGQDALATIDGERREAIRRNHTATHLLHAALRTVLGDHVRQQGSLVSPEYLRFDFSHHVAPTSEELDEVFARANRAVLTAVGVETTETSREEAENMGAIAFFGDKYGSSVRVVQAGPSSLEFCGGTHVDSLGQIGTITLLSEGSIGSNTRRLFAVTGFVSIARALERERLVQSAAELLRTEPDELVAAIGRMMERQREAEKELSRLRQQSSEAEATALAGRPRPTAGWSSPAVTRSTPIRCAAWPTRSCATTACVLSCSGARPTGRRRPSSRPPVGHPDATRLVRTLGQDGRRRGRRLGRGGTAGGERTPLGSRPRWTRRDDFSPRERRRRPDAAPGRGAALDLGARRIGVAYSDSGRSLASPWGTIQRSGDPVRDRTAVVEAVREVEASTVVVGLPLSLSGEVGPAARTALDEAAALRELLEPLGVTVETADERFTTVEAERSLRAAGRTGKAARKVVDSAAAMVLLQAWLDNA